MQTALAKYPLHIAFWFLKNLCVVYSLKLLQRLIIPSLIDRKFHTKRSSTIIELRYSMVAVSNHAISISLYNVHIYINVYIHISGRTTSSLTVRSIQLKKQMFEFGFDHRLQFVYYSCTQALDKWIVEKSPYPSCTLFFFLRLFGCV